jgi:Tfp pilus assembly PilM family ATPase
MITDKTIVGLDIGSDAIKMVEIHHANTGRELLTYGIAKHGITLEGYWDSSRLRQISTIVEEILNSGDFAGVKTVMSVQSKDVYVTTMDFDANWTKHMIQEEIDRQSPYFLPYPPDEMRLSWGVIKNDPRILAFTGKQRVIINALPDFVIENSKNLLEHVNLDGAALENQTVSQIRATLTPDTGNSVLVDIGSKHTTFSILVDGTLRSSSHIDVGMQKINDNLVDALGLDEGVAEYYKRDLNLVNLYELPNEVIEGHLILKSELDTFVELNKKIAQEPAKIIFTGGGVSTVGLMEMFQNYHTPVFAGNCLSHVKVSDFHKPYVMPIINQLSTAIGLALRDDV